MKYTGSTPGGRRGRGQRDGKQERSGKGSCAVERSAQTKRTLLCTLSSSYENFQPAAKCTATAPHPPPPTPHRCYRHPPELPPGVKSLGGARLVSTTRHHLWPWGGSGRPTRTCTGVARASG